MKDLSAAAAAWRAGRACGWPPSPAAGAQGTAGRRISAHPAHLRVDEQAAAPVIILEGVAVARGRGDAPLEPVARPLAFQAA